MNDQPDDLTTAAITSTRPNIGPRTSSEATKDNEIAMKDFQDPKLVTLNDVFEYLHTALNSFEGDPADSDFQRGYEKALSDMRDHFLGVSPSKRLH